MQSEKISRMITGNKEVASQISSKYNVPFDKIKDILSNLIKYTNTVHIPYHCSVDHDGLFAIAIEKLIECCKIFDLTKVDTFYAFCLLRCKGAIMDEMRKTHLMHTRSEKGCPAIISTSQKIYEEEESIETIEDTLISFEEENIEDVLNSVEIKKRVKRQLNYLPKRDKEWVYLYFWHGMFLAEIGKLYNKSESTVYKSLKNIVVQIKDGVER